MPGAIAEAACWAHGRRRFLVLADVAKAPIAIETVQRIDLIFDVERDITGLEAVRLFVARQERVVLWSVIWRSDACERAGSPRRSQPGQD